MQFSLDPRLEADTMPVTSLALCELRLMNDSRWPWLILVPRIQNAEEIHYLERDDQNEVLQEINDVAHALEAVTGCGKVNIAALGNMVRQLHIHIIARHEGDANWPNPIWGYEKSVPYDKTSANRLIKILKAKIESE